MPMEMTCFFRGYELTDARGGNNREIAEAWRAWRELKLATDNNPETDTKPWQIAIAITSIALSLESLGTKLLGLPTQFLLEKLGTFIVTDSWYHRTVTCERYLWLRGHGSVKRPKSFCVFVWSCRRWPQKQKNRTMIFTFFREVHIPKCFQHPAGPKA